MTFLIGGANTLDGAYTIDNSLRFNDDDSPSLNKTFGSGNRKTFTFSTWVKRANITNSNTGLFAGATDSNNRFAIMFVSDNLYIQDRASGSNTFVLHSNNVFRDPSAWYHIVVAIDTTQGTEANRVKAYVNNTQITSFSSASYPSQNLDLQGNNNVFHVVGARTSDGSSGTNFLDGYMSDTYFVDGSAEAPTKFGETNDNGVWIPKRASVTFGTNGFKLEFKQTGTGTASASTIGADTSGEDNHLTSTNLAAIDITTDTPTNNFCTMNPLDNYHSGFTLSEGNCKFLTAGSANAYNTATIGDLKQGKWYLEVKYTDPSSTGSGGSLQYYGAISAIGHKLSDGVSDTDTSTDLYATSYLHNFGYDANNGRIKNNNTAGTVHGAVAVEGDIIGFLLDLDNNRVTTHKNGSYADGSGNHDESSPTAYVSITAPASTPLGGYFIGFDETVGSTEGSNQNTGTYEINFGNPTFSISSGNADGNGYGNFEYAVPSGYYSLCTKNLAEYG
jgi:hypothetical protein